MITLQIKTHDGEVLTEEVEVYNAVELNEQINSNELLTVVIGQRILSRIKIAEVSIVEENFSE